MLKNIFPSSLQKQFHFIKWNLKPTKSWLPRDLSSCGTNSCLNPNLYRDLLQRIKRTNKTT